MATTQVSDIIVPEIFNGYVQNLTEEKSRLIASGAVVRSSKMDTDLAGGGVAFTAPSFKDLANDEENISSDAEDDSYTGSSNNSTPKKTGAIKETYVRLSRNQSWSSNDLTASLAGADPMLSIANQVAGYWARRSQAAMIATMRGVFADNDAAPVAGEHSQGDLTNDISGAAFSAGVTSFSAPALIDTSLTMGDSEDDLSLLCVHSVVYAQMKKNNLIDFIPDARGEVTIPTFLGMQVIKDDGMPSPESGVYESWLFGPGAIQMGMGAPKVPTAFDRKEDAGNGAGQEVLYNRVEWGIHPVGHTFTGVAGDGGPSNAATTGNLAHADSFQRVFTERKQIKIARLITREF